MQLRSRLTMLFSLLVGGIILTSFVFIYFFTYRYNRQQFHQRLDDKAITQAILLTRIKEVDSTLMKVIDRAKRDVLYGENISIYDRDNKEIYTNNDTVFFDVGPQLLNNIREEQLKYFREGNFEISGLTFTEGGSDFVIIAGAIDQRGDTQLANLRTLLFALSGAIIIIVAGTGWIYAGRALKPLNVLIDEVNGISAHDLGKRLKERKYNDEIGKMIRIFNSLLARIENAFSLQKSFVSNVSHELKNPLTKITSQLEVTLLNERTGEEYRKTTESVLEDIRELNLLSGSLLDLASLHEDNRTFTMSRLRIDEILWEVIEKVKSLQPLYQTEVNINLPEEEEKLYVHGNFYLLRTAFLNVIENACKFSADQTARISLLCSEQEIIVRVSDKGPGIEKKDLVNIFQPFYRADRTSKIKGYGVGLSLSQRIIRIHKATIGVESEPGEGTTVTVSFTSPLSF